MLVVHKKRVRLASYDYRESGWYFVTVVTHRRSELFGEVLDGRVIPSHIGTIVNDCWAEIPAHFAHVTSDAFIAMPNHVHGLLYFSQLTGSGQKTHSASSGALGAVIGSFKAAVTRRVRLALPESTGPVWQANYYEHVARDLRSVEHIRWYIESNPERWHLDPENSARTGSDSFERWLAEEGTRPFPSTP